MTARVCRPQRVALRNRGQRRSAARLLFLAAANRDPRRWDQPERFDISRQASGHVGFGFGIHQCLGQMVARLEAETLLEALLPRVAEIRLAGSPVRRLNNTLHAFFSMPVEITMGSNDMRLRRPAATSAAADK